MQVGLSAEQGSKQGWITEDLKVVGNPLRTKWSYFYFIMMNSV